MVEKRNLIIIGSILMISICCAFILGINYGWILGITFRNDEYFTTSDDQFFYNISSGHCVGSQERRQITQFAQIGSKVYFDYKSFDDHVLRSEHPVIYNMSEVDDHSILHISYYKSCCLAVDCMLQHHISGYFITGEQIDSVEFHVIELEEQLP